MGRGRQPSSRRALSAVTGRCLPSSYSRLRSTGSASADRRTTVFGSDLWGTRSACAGTCSRRMSATSPLAVACPVRQDARHVHPRAARRLHLPGAVGRPLADPAGPARRGQRPPHAAVRRTGPVLRDPGRHQPDLETRPGPARPGRTGRLLDTYGPERADHVQHAIALSVALGEVICVSESASNRRRPLLRSACLLLLLGGADGSAHWALCWRTCRTAVALRVGLFSGGGRWRPRGVVPSGAQA